MLHLSAVYSSTCKILAPGCVGRRSGRRKHSGHGSVTTKMKRSVTEGVKRVIVRLLAGCTKPSRSEFHLKYDEVIKCHKFNCEPGRQGVSRRFVLKPFTIRSRIARNVGNVDTSLMRFRVVFVRVVASHSRKVLRNLANARSSYHLVFICILNF